MQYFFTQFNPPVAPGFLLSLAPFIVVIALWSITLKGFALWHAARGHQKWWFIALLVINTVGILEIIYLIWFRPASSASATPVQSSSAQA
jgi:methionyl-tRNA synthetase